MNRFEEDDCEFSLGLVELEVPLRYHCGILNKQWDTASGIQALVCSVISLGVRQGSGEVIPWWRSMFI